MQPILKKYYIHSWQVCW